MYIPCSRCGGYSKECDDKCLYARTVKVLEEVLTSADHCTVTCKKSYYQPGVPWDCDHTEECKNRSLYEIDWNKVYNEYNIKLEE